MFIGSYIKFNIGCIAPFPPHFLIIKVVQQKSYVLAYNKWLFY